MLHPPAPFGPPLPDGGFGSKPRGDDEMGRRKPYASTREAALWLLDRLGTEPRLMKELVVEAEKAGFSEKDFLRGARNLPILRRPRELRGPWVWSLPREDEQVLVSFNCPLSHCPSSAAREGWLELGESRLLFKVGLLRYRIRGRMRIRRPAESEEHLLRVEESHLEHLAVELERQTYREVATKVEAVLERFQAVQEEWARHRDDFDNEPRFHPILNQWDSWDEALKRLFACHEGLLDCWPGQREGHGPE